MRVSFRLIAALAGAFAAWAASAVDITVAGLFRDKALVQIDGGAPQTLAVGQKTSQGVVLLSVDADAATFEVDGKVLTIGMGQGRNTTKAASPAPPDSVQLLADSRGHFMADGKINGQPVRFIVDTGATLVMLSSAEATRLAIDYHKGARAAVNTANGRVLAYRIKLDKVTVGGITLYAVDGAVTETETGPPESLLGMSFLNRTDMERKGPIMTLTRRY